MSVAKASDPNFRRLFLEANLLHLASRIGERNFRKPSALEEARMRFAAFVNEEPPFFLTEGMGSLRYARLCRSRGERVVAMLSLETMGYYSGEEGSQPYPFAAESIYPDTGGFIALVEGLASVVSLLAGAG